MMKFEIENDLEGRSAIVCEAPFAAVGNFLSSSVRTGVMFNEVKKSIAAVKNGEVDLPFELGFDAHDLIINDDEVSIERYYGQSDIATLPLDEFTEILHEWEKVLSHS